MTGLVDGLLTPSRRDEGGYEFFLIGFAHIGLGAAMGGLVGVPLALLLFAAKEALWDMRRGGRLLDCAIDTGFVAAGGLFVAHAVPELAWLALALAVTAVRGWARA